MASKFTTDLDNFKKEFSIKGSKNASSQKSSDFGDITELSERFASFEESVLSSLQSIRQDLTQLKSNLGKHVMSTNQNAILVHGVDETKSKDLYDCIINIIIKNIGIQIRKSDLNYCYRFGPKKTEAKTPRPVVVSFYQRWLRDDIFFKKKVLKGTNILFTELLTKEAFLLYKETRKHFQKSCWTMGGKVHVFNDGVKTVISSKNELESIIGKRSECDCD